MEVKHTIRINLGTVLLFIVALYRWSILKAECTYSNALGFSLIAFCFVTNLIIDFGIIKRRDIIDGMSLAVTIGLIGWIVAIFTT